jgi:hypothetical protein
MKIVYFLIDPEDYETFRRMPDMRLQASYDEWLQGRLKERNDCIKGRVIVREITVKPKEFAAYCRSLNIRHDLDALRQFAVEKSRRSPD